MLRAQQWPHFYSKLINNVFILNYKEMNKVKTEEHAIFCNKTYGPCFGY